MPAHRLPLEVHTNCASNFRAEDLFRLCRCSAVHRDLYQTAAYDEFVVELFVVGVDYFSIDDRHKLRVEGLTSCAREWDNITPSLERQCEEANTIAAQAKARAQLAMARRARLEAAFANKILWSLSLIHI